MDITGVVPLIISRKACLQNQDTSLSSRFMFFTKCPGDYIGYWNLSVKGHN